MSPDPGWPPEPATHLPDTSATLRYMYTCQTRALHLGICISGRSLEIQQQNRHQTSDHNLMTRLTWDSSTHRIHALHKAMVYESDKTLVGCSALAAIGIVQVLSIKREGHQGKHEDDGQTQDGHQDQRHTCQTPALHLGICTPVRHQHYTWVYVYLPNTSTTLGYMYTCQTPVLYLGICVPVRHQHYT